MSFLNQVLQDLDAREARAPVRRSLSAVDPPAGPPAAAGAGRPARDWLRIGVWTAVGLLVGGYLLYEASLDPPAPPQIRPAQPMAAAGGGPALGSGSFPERNTAPAPQRPAAPAAAAPPGPSASLPADAQPIPAMETEPEAAVPGSRPGPPDGAEQGAWTPPRSPVSTRPPAGSPAARVDESASAYQPAPLPSQLPAARPVPRSSTPLVAKRPAPGSGERGDWLTEVRRDWSRGRLAGAEAGLRRVLERRPQELVARELLTVLLVRGDRLAEAEQQIEQGLSHHPGHPGLVLLRARLLAQRGESAAAAAVLEASGLAESGDTGALAMLGALYQQRGSYADSVAVYGRLLRQAPDKGAYWAGLGIGLEALGETEAALEAFQRALVSPGLPRPVADYVRQRRNLLE